MPNTHEQKFTFALRDIFVGASIEGDSGYINLMRIKSRYYTEGVFPRLMEKISEELAPFPNFREELFDKLYTFFKRYFSESGSIYFRHTPYYQDIFERIYTDDRDVMLFWKTQNLYYVKTDRLFRSLTLSLDDEAQPKFAFDASAVAKQSFAFDASTLQNKRNNEKRNLIFEYKGVGENELLKFAVQYSQGARKTKTDDILKQIKKDGVKVNEDQLTRAFRLFERQSEVDFFINKNAKAFLEEQFDLWMYQYLFKRESDWTEKRIKEMQALKRVAYAIIEFIAQFEDELVRIWNKPKFALASNYVITFDRVFGKSEITARKLLAHEGITAQIAEWQTLGMIDDDFTPDTIFEVEATNSTLPFDSEESDNSPLSTLNSQLRFLPFDTKHFKSLEIEILSLFDNLDEELDGRLIHSENYQALNTLKDKFREKVKCIYIDPPYNTGSDEFIYKDGYRNSAWLSMMENRLSLARQTMSNDGAIFISIDDNQVSALRHLNDQIFDRENFLNILAWEKRYSPPPDTKDIGYVHESIICNRKSPSFVRNLLPLTSEQIGRYKNPDNDKRGVWKAMDYTCKYSKDERPNLYYPIINPFTKEEVYPKTSRVWGFSQDEHLKNERDNVVWWGNEGKSKVPAKKNFLDKIQQGFMPTSLLKHEQFGHTDEASKELKELFPEIKFTPKPTRLIKNLTLIATNNNSVILDFFAGSGTTAHAVINLNREDGGRRKYILVEANDYFHTVILPRVKKVVFSDKWKDGKTRADGKGVSHFCKYFALEQYEDTLRRAVYLNDSKTETPSFFDNPDETPFSSYVFLRDKKMSDALKVDYADNKISVDFSRLYSDIDLAETLSCIKGKFIKRVTREAVEFADGELVRFDEIDYRDLLPLIWWDK